MTECCWGAMTLGADYGRSGPRARWRGESNPAGQMPSAAWHLSAAAKFASCKVHCFRGSWLLALWLAVMAMTSQGLGSSAAQLKVKPNVGQACWSLLPVTG